MNNKISLLYLATALLALLLGMLFGIFSGLQYILPEFIKEILPFSSLRPFHVTSVIAWIILCAIGGIYYYLSNSDGPRLYSNRLSKIHYLLFGGIGILIYYNYAIGNFGGKEYLEFPPYLILPILIGWLLFGINYYKTMAGKVKDWPVYYWMWGTGIVFMVYHLSEAYLWLHPDMKNNFIKSLAIQWKAGGSFVGSWNMLVYGTAIYVMAKIKGDDSIGRHPKSFFFYFLGLTNLMFGWAHHIYIVPTAPWVRYVAYGISMTEWIILFHMIYEWKKSLPESAKIKNLISYKFLVMADAWVFLNLILALLFSIPAINFFTHGTHITVAHSMGTTIGINTTILLASVLFIVNQIKPNFNLSQVKIGFRIFNISLLLFWLSLLIAGMKRSYWMYFTKGIPFAEMQSQTHWVYVSFLLFGIGIFIGLLLIVVPVLKIIGGTFKQGKQMKLITNEKS
ncbi:MAG TPA: cbb3-type cytochrome c oxidase subunit I [Flavobacterium sp.]|uniref:cbb3-type cytochrome c oxidase subunit I n=1 Tax=Flavobacterium sp. TaxID=239 RepID=UPI002C85BA13|nr:cbb3-type cytochrome c oxidase subunit I [Flavobacterium sp.]HSD14348.1 cbb3-type cytochrome c oxidase subunit I [Flavobacterium sp.]